MSSVKEDFYIEVFARRSESRRDYTYVSYSDGCLSFIEGSDYPKDDYDECYGMILDKAASDKLISLIKKDGQTLEEAVKERYKGIDILYLVERFLKENDIPFRWSSNKYELGW